jgi:hypothetical protein
MKYNKIVVFITLLVLLMLPHIHAQTLTVDKIKSSATPATPEAAALFKFVDIPVSEYTGTANINVPITQLNNGELSVGVSLSYHSSGNKVNEYANWVGLGWKLNAGGMISRKVRGKPDDVNGGFIEYRTTKTYTQTLTEVTSTTTLYSQSSLAQDLNNSCKDAQPDEFYFDINGYSGKFAFDWT